MASLAERALAALGLRRAEVRKRSAYAGAASTRLTADWIFAPTVSADQEVRGDLRTLRARAREMVRNNAYATRFAGLVSENVIGPHGIRLQARVKKGSGDLKNSTNDRIEAAWAEWCRAETCTVDGRLCFADVEDLVARSLPQDGEFLVRMVPGFDNRFGFAIQVLDPDLLDVGFDGRSGEGNEIRMGVEINGWGRPMAYWLLSAHPADPASYGADGRRRHERVPAEQIIHGYLMRRPGQTRGVTWYAPILLDAKMLAGYQEAELVAARTAAAKMGFFKPDADAVGDPDAPDAGVPITMEATPGTFDTLPPGYEFQSWDPQHPNSAFKDFSKSILRSIATGLGVSYTSLANDLEAVNYSSIRAGLLAERDGWKRLQRWLTDHLHQRIYEEWLRWALTTGALVLPAEPARYRAVEWQCRGWPWVDPLKDIQASAAAVALGLDSRRRLAAEQGRDFEEILADLDRENQLAAVYGVTINSGAPNGSQGNESDSDEAGEAAGDAADDDAGARRDPVRLVRRAD